jgi:hypothetical protein
MYGGCGGWLSLARSSVRRRSLTAGFAGAVVFGPFDS